LQTPCPPQPDDSGGQSAALAHFTLQCMPFCMKVAQRPLAQSASTRQVAPKTAPMLVPVLVVALLLPLAALLVDVPLALEVVAAAPPLPPWPPAPLPLAVAPDDVAVLVPGAPPEPVLVLEVVLSPPQPAAMIPIPVMASVQRIEPSASFDSGSLCADLRSARCDNRVNKPPVCSRKFAGRAAVYQR
jgi:hypothetical protein